MVNRIRSKQKYTHVDTIVENRKILDERNG